MTRNTKTIRTVDVSASYARRSKDLDNVGLNVASQERDNVQRAEDNGTTIPTEHRYVDNDVAASRFAKKVRTDWLKLREAIEHGPVNNIYTLMLDRLLRLPGELEWLIDQAFAGNFRCIVTDEDVLDLTTESGISRARGMAHAADMEVRKLSKRVRRAFNEKRNNGRSHQPVISLGWLGTRHGHDNNDGDTLHTWEAALILDAAKRSLKGTSYNTLAAEWTNKGVIHPKEQHHARNAGRTPKFKPWTATEVKFAVTSPRNAGFITHNGEVVGRVRDATGNEVAPIIPEALWRKITAQAERRKVGPRTRRSGMWTGFVRCGGVMDDGTPCGAVMLMNTNGVDANGQRRVTFRCAATPGRRACGNNGIMAKYVEPMAHAWLIGYAENASAELRRGKMKDDAAVDRITAELRQLKTRRDEVMEDRGLGVITRADANRAVTMIAEREAELARQLDRAGGNDAFTQWHGDGEGLAEWLASDACAGDEHRAVFLATDHFAWIMPRGTARPSKSVDSNARIVFGEDHPANDKRARKRRTA